MAYEACNASCPHNCYGKCDEDKNNHPGYHHCNSCGKHWVK